MDKKVYKFNFEEADKYDPAVILIPSDKKD